MGGRRYQRVLWVTEPSLRGVSELMPSVLVFQVWAPFSCFSVHEGIKGNPAGSQRQVRRPGPSVGDLPWLALTSMLVSHGGRRGRDMAFPPW